MDLQNKSYLVELIKLNNGIINFYWRPSVKTVIKILLVLGIIYPVFSFFKTSSLGLIKGPFEGVMRIDKKKSEFIVEKETSVYPGEIIKTGDGQFLEINIFKNSFVNLGPKSSVKFLMDKEKNILELLEGQIRIKMDKKDSALIKIGDQFKINSFSGEISVNLYDLNSKKISDFLVIDGNLELDISKLFLKEQNLKLISGDIFNSTQVELEGGSLGTRNLKDLTLKKFMDNQKKFLPFMQNEKGEFRDIQSI